MKIRALGVLLIALVALSAFGQAAVRLPEASPAATVGQTIGVTDVSITYHRPGASNRKIFGGLVQYNDVWRAGANENTTISFSTPVKIEGQALPAGTYGLFMIPTASQWTIVFSKFAEGWGAYSYDPSEDALRVTVTPQTLAGNEERLAYTFDDLTNNGATASLRWANLRIPFKIEVDIPATVQASIRTELRGAKHWNADAWAAAARWELRNGNVDTANEFADHAMGLSISTNTLRTKAAVLQKKGDKQAAEELQARAKQIFNEAEDVSYTGYGLLGQKKYDEAISYLTNYVAAHPNSAQVWRAYSLLGDAYAHKGDQAKSREAFDKAMKMAHDSAEREEVQDTVNALGAEGIG
ncbi:MAG TPA: DUF2911 domain-containing protein [Thermoanaerobaculia bacterium]|nr:DUF2911 domain-containing protein [Thermoanaerobaculia bacterium]